MFTLFFALFRSHLRVYHCRFRSITSHTWVRAHSAVYSAHGVFTISLEYPRYKLSQSFFFLFLHLVKLSRRRTHTHTQRALWKRGCWCLCGEDCALQVRALVPTSVCRLESRTRRGSSRGWQRARDVCAATSARANPRRRIPLAPPATAAFLLLL